MKKLLIGALVLGLAFGLVLPVLASNGWQENSHACRIIIKGKGTAVNQRAGWPNGFPDENWRYWVFAKVAQDENYSRGIVIFRSDERTIIVGRIKKTQIGEIDPLTGKLKAARFYGYARYRGVRYAFDFAYNRTEDSDGAMIFYLTDPANFGTPQGNANRIWQLWTGAFDQNFTEIIRQCGWWWKCFWPCRSDCWK
ncbi:hypothetical protein J7K42_01265 [bacterium]|nr:hypothetical protein [bacterium]